MMSYKHIETEHLNEGKLVMLYLNDPETFNSLNAEMLKELRRAVGDANRDESIRCIALSGRGRAFCSGQNLKEALGFGDIVKDRTVQRFIIDYYNPLVKEIIGSKKPVVSLLNGPAVGAGAILALLSDFSLASSSSYLSFAFVNIGLIPDTGGTYILPKLLGSQRASYYSFTGKRIPAEKALEMGLVVEVYSDETFQSESMDVLFDLCQQPTKAIGLTKKAFNESYDNTLKEQLDIEGILQQSAAETMDFSEGVSAFLEKRKPVYKGN